MEYDGFTDVEIFVRRIVSMVDRHGQDGVLSALPLCLKGQARKWYDKLNGDVLYSMDDYIDTWVIQLGARFQNNPLCAEEATRVYMEYLFTDPKRVRQFIEKGCDRKLKCLRLLRKSSCRF